MKRPQRGTHSRPRTAPRLTLEPLEARENPVGVGGLDPSFASDGRVTTDFMADDRAVAVLLQPDGKTVVVGTVINASSDIAVIRYNPDGTLDDTFANGTGKFSVSLGANDNATDAVLQPDGTIVVVGFTDNGGTNDFAVIRVLADGSDLDSTFGTAGKQVVDFGADDRATAVALRPDGRIVVGGNTDAGSADFAVVQLTTAGQLDTAGFGTGTGKFALSFLGKDFVQDVAIQDDGNIVLVGFTDMTNPGVSNDFAVARVLADGSNVDNAFGAMANGRVTIDFTNNDDKANAVALRPDGRIVVVGSWDGGFSDYMVAQLTTGGVLDTTFGSGFFGAGSGKFNITFGTGTFGQAEFATDVAILPDGRLVVVGRTDNDVAGGPNDFGIVRVLADGSGLDTTFDTDGKVTVDFSGGDDKAEAVAVSPTGRITITGSSGATSSFVTARLIGTVERSTILSVGGSATGTANVYVPDATGQYNNPPAATTPDGLFGGFAGDVRVATGDFNADGFADTVLVTGPGIKTAMAVVSGKDDSVLLASADPFGDANFTFGGFVTAGDIDGDGRAEWVVTPELRGGPRVIIFRLNDDGSTTLVGNFFGIQDDTFRDGSRAALGDVNGDGLLDVYVIAAFNGGPRTAQFDGQDVLIHLAQGRAPVKLTNDFFATTTGTDDGRGGRGIALGDVDGDGVADFIVTGDNLLGTGNRVTIFSGADLVGGIFPGGGATVLADFSVSGQSGSALLSVATVNADGDNRADLAVGSGAGQSSLVRVYLGTNLSGTAEPTSTSFDPFGAVTINGVFVG